jgi:hypothetical protein
MITADTLRRCAYLDTISLENLLRKAYPTDSLLRSEFLGITNGGQFAYKCAYFDSNEDAEDICKVFVWQDNNGELVADY